VTDPLLLETARYVAIRRLQNRYADVVTRRAWAELDEVFLADAVVELDTRAGTLLRLEGPGAVGEFIGTAIADFEFFEFVILSHRIEIADAGDTASGRMYICELRQEGDGRFTVAYGVYHDDYRAVDDRWWIAGRRYHSLARTSANGPGALDVFAFPHHLRLATD
jgi:hypothetical protein